MGPPIGIGGNVRLLDALLLERLASMGPPIGIGGNRTRKRARSSPTSTCFNGAADRNRRKLLLREVRVDERRLASMGPPIGIGGNGTTSSTTEQGYAMLQWGRRSESAETQSSAAARVGGRGASMGPPIGIGGNWGRSTTHKALAEARLQWGRRSESAETAIFVPVPVCSTELQWGRRSESAETRTPGHPKKSHVVLQWGRRSESAETSSRPRRRTSSRSFNGAADRNRRKQRAAFRAPFHGVTRRLASGQDRRTLGRVAGAVAEVVRLVAGTQFSWPRARCERPPPFRHHPAARTRLVDPVRRRWLSARSLHRRGRASGFVRRRSVPGRGRRRALGRPARGWRGSAPR